MRSSNNLLPGKIPSTKALSMKRLGNCTARTETTRLRTRTVTTTLPPPTIRTVRTQKEPKTETLEMLAVTMTKPAVKPPTKITEMKEEPILLEGNRQKTQKKGEHERMLPLLSLRFSPLSIAGNELPA